MKRSAYVLALLAFAAAIVISGVFTNPQPEVMAKPRSPPPPPHLRPHPPRHWL